MPRVNVQRKNRVGKERRCGKCGHVIQPGEEYKSWSFRYGGTHYRCMKFACRPRPSNLTQSLLGEVYSAQESAEDTLAALLAGDDHEESVAEQVKEAVDEVKEAAESVAEQYYEASEPFQYQGENAERSEDLQGWSSELEGFEPDPEADAEDVISQAQELVGGCPL